MSDFLLVFLAIIILFGVFRRYIAFYIMQAVARGIQSQIGKMQNQQQPHQPPPPSSVKKQKPQDQGEYVDFEEIKD